MRLVLMIIKTPEHFNMAADVAIDDDDPDQRSYSGIFADTEKGRNEMAELVIAALEAFSQRSKEVSGGR